MTFEYLVCNEYGDIMFSYYNEEDALTQVYKHQGWSLSRQPVELKVKETVEDEQNT